MTIKERREKLVKQSKVIAKMLYNGNLSVSEALNPLTKLSKQLDELDIEEDYINSLADCLDTPSAFLYKGKI